MDKQYETITVKATEIHRNDFLLGLQSMGGQPLVKKVETKVKWVYVTDTNDKVWEFPKDQADVLVMRETKESRDARIEAEHREHRNEKILDWFGKYEERRFTKAVQAEINETLSHDGALVGYFEMEKFITAQAKDKVAARIQNAIRVFQEKQADGAEHPANDLVDVIGLLVESYKESLVSNYRGLSRSTSAVSNVLDDADREIKADFVDNPWRWVNTF